MRSPEGFPSPRTLAFVVAGSVALGGAGLAFWGFPLTPPLGRPGVDPAAPASPTDLPAQQVSSSPTLASDPTDERVLALANRIEGPELGCALQVSGDGGESWTGAQPVPVLPAGVEHCYAPDVAFDGDGTLHYLFVGLAGGVEAPIGVFLTSSRDRAQTFSEPRQVLGARSYGARLAASGERLHLAWLEAGEKATPTGFASDANVVKAAYTDDGGISLSEPIPVSGDRARRVAGPAVSVAPAGGVEVAYYDLGDDARDYRGDPGPVWEGTWTVELATSADRGERFEPPTIVDESAVAPWRVGSIFTIAPPALATGREHTCLAWTDARFGDPDVVLRCSSETGWSPVKRVNDDRQGSGAWQYLPQLALAPNGRLDVVFYDRRGHPRNDLVAVAFSYSYDRLNFSASTPLTRSFFAAAAGPPSGAGPADGRASLGSHLGLLAQDTSTVAAWADARNAGSTSDLLDVYTAQVSLLFSSGRPLWALPTGGVLAVSGTAGMWAFRRRDRIA